MDQPSRDLMTYLNQVCLAAVAAFRKSESYVRFAFRLVMMDNTVCSVFESNTPDREEVGGESQVLP
jgi:hypothetical protein